MAADPPSSLVASKQVCRFRAYPSNAEVREGSRPGSRQQRCLLVARMEEQEFVPDGPCRPRTMAKSLMQTTLQRAGGKVSHMLEAELSTTMPPIR